MTRMIMECITWGLAGVFFATFLILCFGLSYEQIENIFNALGAK